MRTCDDGPPTEWLLGLGDELKTRDEALAYASVAKGWQPIIDYLFHLFDFYCKKVYITQVKEKFGTLRFYGDPIERRDPGPWVKVDIDEAIHFAEGISAYICMHCGRPGKLREGGWLVTLCGECNDGRAKPGVTDNG